MPLPLFTGEGRDGGQPAPDCIQQSAPATQSATKRPKNIPAPRLMTWGEIKMPLPLFTGEGRDGGETPADFSAVSISAKVHKREVGPRMPPVADHERGKAARSALRKRNLYTNRTVKRIDEQSKSRLQRVIRQTSTEASQCPDRRMGGRQRGGVGHQRANGPASVAYSPGRVGDSRYTKLQLARVRHARGVLAHQEDPRRSGHQGDGQSERLRLQQLSGGVQVDAGLRVGAHGPRLQAEGASP